MEEDSKKLPLRQGKGQGEEQGEEQDVNDEKTTLLLHEGLNTLDDLFPAFTPSPAWFDQQIVETKSKQRSRLLGDLLKLWLAALLLLFILYMTLTSQPVAFLSLQALAIIVPLAWLLIRKQVDSHE